MIKMKKGKVKTKSTTEHTEYTEKNNSYELREWTPGE